ncbi:MAG: hypothetical protein ACYCZO_15115 [Daejeonella sp.]
MYIALEAGIGLGAFMAGSFYVTDISRVPPTFYITAMLTLIVFLYLQFVFKHKVMINPSRES